MQAYYLTCEQVGALKIRGDFGNLRETLKVARRVRRMPPPPWAGAYVRLTLYRDNGGRADAALRGWEWIGGVGQWKRATL